MNEYSRIFDLSGKIALITGGVKGIGANLAKGLAEFGCDIVVVDIDIKNKNRVVNAINKKGKRCLFLFGDVSDNDSIQEAVEKAISYFGKIDILVNNAGCNIRKPAVEYTEKEWDLIIDTNLKGVFLTTKAVGKAMIKNRRGKIINIASVMGLVGSPPYQFVVPYCASKGGVVQLTRSFALEWAKYNIHVNAIAPGTVKTSLTKAFFEDKRTYQAILQMIPLKRLAKADDLIGPTVFLASNASNYMTGHILFVDGGWLAQ
jgi:NAD(P)-dependent dehydrogenase (short-subunit alcohol dehydrogenase family)